MPSGDHVRAVVSDGTMAIHHNAGRISVPADPSEDRDGWLGMRRLSLGGDGRRLEIRVDDLDPYRDCYQMTVAQRIPSSELAEWCGLFDDAWTLLVRQIPWRASELSVGLRYVVPLVDSEGDPGLSATSRDAFGAFALNRPRSAAALAATMVHEFQHSKLSALLDLVPLYERQGQRLYHAPWRSDGRPVGALLQGAYAFLGVADFWHALSEASIYAGLREQVAYVLPQLLGSDQLTPAGRRFVVALGTALDDMPIDGVPQAVLASARRAMLASRADWHRDRRQIK
jgi:HEXXH motif-containing protein